MTATCPNGHTSAADDYCDVCGAPIDSAAGGSSDPAADVGGGLDLDQPADVADPGPGAAPMPPTGSEPAAPAGQVCPDCATLNTPDALFCEGCGYDFTTRTSARGAGGAAAPTDEGSGQGGVTATGSAGSDANAAGPSFDWVAEVWIDPAWYDAQQASDPMPSPGLPSVVPLRKTSLLVGRRSQSRNIEPDIDCEPDTATSRRQTQLTTDGTRWFVEDLQSANGTFVGPASGALPDDPIPPGSKHELQPDDRIYVGAWTRIVVRRATADEQSTL